MMKIQYMMYLQLLQCGHVLWFIKTYLFELLLLSIHIALLHLNKLDSAFYRKRGIRHFITIHYYCDTMFSFVMFTGGHINKRMFS